MPASYSRVPTHATDDDEAEGSGSRDDDALHERGKPGVLEHCWHVHMYKRVAIVVALFCTMWVVLASSPTPRDTSTLRQEIALSSAEEEPEEESGDLALQQTVSRKSLQNRCPADSNVKFLLPHVPKSGGRGLEATFMSLSRVREHVSKERRSRTHLFEIDGGHSTLQQFLHKYNCEGSACEITSAKDCRRWIFVVRDPIARLLSAFYTSVGRPKGSHFPCEKNSVAEEHLTHAEYSIEDWAQLPVEERNKCSGIFNIYNRFLASDIDDPAERLEVAKERLVSLMSWVAVLEKLDESLQLFQYIFGTDLVHYTTVFNLNKYSKELTPRTRKVLEDHNRYDLELYKFALELHSAQMAKMRADSSDPFYKPLSFKCDENVTCFDKKKKRNSPAWSLSQAAWDKHFPDPGAAKQRQLCTPTLGCWREDVGFPPKN